MRCYLTLLIVFLVALTQPNNAKAVGEGVRGNAFLIMNTNSDLDIHAFTPWGTHVYWDNVDDGHGAFLTNDGNPDDEPGFFVGATEQLIFPIVPGQYQFQVNNYFDRQTGNNPYILKLQLGDSSFKVYTGTLGSTGDAETFTINSTGGLSQADFDNVLANVNRAHARVSNVGIRKPVTLASLFSYQLGAANLHRTVQQMKDRKRNRKQREQRETQVQYGYGDPSPYGEIYNYNSGQLNIYGGDGINIGSGGAGADIIASKTSFIIGGNNGAIVWFPGENQSAIDIERILGNIKNKGASVLAQTCAGGNLFGCGIAAFGGGVFIGMNSSSDNRAFIEKYGYAYVLNLTDDKPQSPVSFKGSVGEARLASGAPDPDDDKNKEKSVWSLKKRIQEHKEKLDLFKKNPDYYDNKGTLKDAGSEDIRKKIIDGRIKKLEAEIKKFENEIKKILGDR